MASIFRALPAVCLLAALLLLSGCDVDVQPVGGAEGRTLVYAVVGRQGVPNGGIVCTRVGCIVIDPMLSPAVGNTINTQALTKSKIFWDSYHAAMKGRPATLQPPVLYVLNTTFRATHTFGNQSFDKADIISTPRAKDRMVKDGPGMREELRDQWKIPGLETHYVAAATLTVDGTMNIDTPEVKAQFISMGDCVGDGDAVVYLPGQKVLFAGDLVIPNNIPYFKGRTQTVKKLGRSAEKIGEARHRNHRPRTWQRRRKRFDHQAARIFGSPDCGGRCRSEKRLDRGSSGTGGQTGCVCKLDPLRRLVRGKRETGLSRIERRTASSRSGEQSRRGLSAAIERGTSGRLQR